MKLRALLLVLPMAALMGCQQGRVQFHDGRIQIFPPPSPPPAAPSHSASEAAAKGLETLRKMVATANSPATGFTSGEDMKAAELGQPLHVYFVRLDRLKAYRPEQDPQTLLVDIGQDLYPVVKDGQVRSSVIAGKVDGGFRAVGFGGAGYAEALSTSREEGVKRDSLPPQAYSEVQVSAMNLSFLAYRPPNGPLMLVPLPGQPLPAPMDSRIAPGVPVEASVVFTALSQIAQTQNFGDNGPT